MPEQEELPDWLTPEDLWQALRISRRTLFDYLDKGMLPPPHYWSARKLRWHRIDLEGILRHGPAAPGTYPPRDKAAPKPMPRPEAGRHIPPLPENRERVPAADQPMTKATEPPADTPLPEAGTGVGGEGSTPQKAKKGRKKPKPKPT